MDKKNTETQEKAKEAVTKLTMLAFRDGFNTALIQLESFLIQTYSNKVLGVSNPEEIVSLADDEMTKVLDTKVPLGTFLGAINKTRESVSQIMQYKSKPKEDKPANQMDGGIIMQ